MKIKLVEISRDSSLRKLPKDSLLRDLYLSQLALTGGKMETNRFCK